ncbi:hypothetical protein [Dyadobacter tibetensis]|uniref:hypothetical protein n=1 Tax=Dyadobacter tibetensis TaxID=1211851 RepID=UPI0005C73549|nr:hypothetical protein [Dyadobacter tibetensis]
MKEHNETGTIPAQYDGKEIVAQTIRECETIEAAVALFEVARLRLLDVNRWNELTNQPVTNFQITDRFGTPVDRTVEEGDCLRIDIPGPGTKSGDGRDWVMVELIKEYDAPNVKSVGIRVRPTTNPGKMDKATAHFYGPESTSTFTITQEGRQVTAAIYDKNLQINDTAENLGDDIRNKLVGIIGIGVYSHHQWKMLTEGLLD